VTNLESEVETLSRTVAQQRQKLAELGDERDELMRQIRCAEDDCQKLKKDNRYSVYLLYWYKSTNTDAAVAQCA
jgi:cell division protein FtsB